MARCDHRCERHLPLTCPFLQVCERTCLSSVLSYRCVSIPISPVPHLCWLAGVWAYLSLNCLTCPFLQVCERTCPSPVLYYRCVNIPVSHLSCLTGVWAYLPLTCAVLQACECTCLSPVLSYRCVCVPASHLCCLTGVWAYLSHLCCLAGVWAYLSLTCPSPVLSYRCVCVPAPHLCCLTGVWAYLSHLCCLTGVWVYPSLACTSPVLSYRCVSVPVSPVLSYRCVSVPVSPVLSCRCVSFTCAASGSRRPPCRPPFPVASPASHTSPSTFSLTAPCIGTSGMRFSNRWRYWRPTRITGANLVFWFCADMLLPSHHFLFSLYLYFKTWFVCLVLTGLILHFWLFNLLKFDNIFPFSVKSVLYYCLKKTSQVKIGQFTLLVCFTGLLVDLIHSTRCLQLTPLLLSGEYLVRGLGPCGVYG